MLQCVKVNWIHFISFTVPKIFLIEKKIQQSRVLDSHSHLGSFHTPLAVWMHLKRCLLFIYLLGFFTVLVPLVYKRDSIKRESMYTHTHTYMCIYNVAILVFKIHFLFSHISFLPMPTMWMCLCSATEDQITWIRKIVLLIFFFFFF